MEKVELTYPEYYMLRIIKRHVLLNKPLKLDSLKCLKLNYLEGDVRQKVKFLKETIYSLKRKRLIDGTYRLRLREFLIYDIVNFHKVGESDGKVYITFGVQENINLYQYYLVSNDSNAYALEGDNMENLAISLLKDLGVIDYEVSSDRVLLKTLNGDQIYTLYRKYYIDEELLKFEEDYKKLEEVLKTLL